jgi:hypothetical protein
MFRHAAAPSFPSSTDEVPTNGTDQRETDEDEGDEQVRATDLL